MTGEPHTPCHDAHGSLSFQPNSPRRHGDTERARARRLANAAIPLPRSAVIHSCSVWEKDETAFHCPSSRTRENGRLVFLNRCRKG